MGCAEICQKSSQPLPFGRMKFTPLPQRLGRIDDMPRSVKILDIHPETPFVSTFTLDISVGAQPGQFVMLWLPRVDEKPFSVAFDDGKTLQLTIARVGTLTEALFKRKAWEEKSGNKEKSPQAISRVGIRGPYGRTFSYEKGEHLAVVGGGYGAAPLYFLAHQAVGRGCTVEFIVGARSAEHLLFVERAKKLKGVTVHVATDDGSAGFKGYNAALLGEMLGGRMTNSELRIANGEQGNKSNTKAANVRKIDRILTVGPEKMMKAVSDLALKHNIPCQVSVERYMKCGFGVCGQCCIDDSGMATCMEGPVMDHVRARTQVEFGAYHRDKVGRRKNW